MADTLKIEYRLTPPCGSEHRFDIVLDAKTLALQIPPRDDLPEWAALEFEQCANCPLKAADTPHCPLARELVEVVDLCGDLCSYDQMLVDVTTPERRTICQTTVQRGIASLMGLLIATCGCPHTQVFRPMARFHLPVATEEETIYRATSMYLLSQHFARRRGQSADLELEGLLRAYREVHVVNMHVARRLRQAVTRDGSLNALIILDLFSKALPDTIEDSLAEIEYLVEPVLAALSASAAAPAEDEGRGEQEERPRRTA